MKKTLTSKRRMKRTKAGGSRGSGFRAGLLGAVSVCVWLSAFPPADALSAEKKAAGKYALIAGTVFRNSGLSLPGAEVVVTPETGENAGRKPGKPRPIRTFSDARGEFAIRVPARPVRYTVSVKAAGHLSEEKQISIQSDERVDLFFRLEPASK